MALDTALRFTVNHIVQGTAASVPSPPKRAQGHCHVIVDVPCDYLQTPEKDLEELQLKAERGKLPASPDTSPGRALDTESLILVPMPKPAL